jgi:general stress protein YciG
VLYNANYLLIKIGVNKIHKTLKIMTQTKGNSKKGFASMDYQKQREIASKGGRASALADTSRRGFASMDKEKQREISSLGGRSQGHRRLQEKRAAELKGEQSSTDNNTNQKVDNEENKKSNEETSSDE